MYVEILFKSPWLHNFLFWGAKCLRQQIAGQGLSLPSLYVIGGRSEQGKVGVSLRTQARVQVVSRERSGAEDGQPSDRRTASERIGVWFRRTGGANASGQDSPRRKRQKIRAPPTGSDPPIESEVGSREGVAARAA